MSIQGQILEVTVVACSKLKDTEWISRQDPYVCLEYATTKFRTRTCTDGGKNPSFQEKTTISLIEGLREISVAVWNSNTLTHDNFIGSGRVLLHKVLTEGYDDSSWPIQTKSGRFAGEVKLIMHYSNAGKTEKPGKTTMYPSSAPTAPPYSAPPPYNPPTVPQCNPASLYASPYPTATPYPAGYPIAPYPPAPYAPPPTYAPSQTYPPVTYPPQQYPPPPAQPSYPPAPYPGFYPPPPY